LGVGIRGVRQDTPDAIISKPIHPENLCKNVRGQSNDGKVRPARRKLSRESALEWTSKRRRMFIPFKIADLLADLSALRPSRKSSRYATLGPSMRWASPDLRSLWFHPGGVADWHADHRSAQGEATVLRLAYAYEQATDWHNRHSAADSQ